MSYKDRVLRSNLRKWNNFLKIYMDKSSNTARSMEKDRQASCKSTSSNAPETSNCRQRFKNGEIDTTVSTRPGWSKWNSWEYSSNQKDKASLINKSKNLLSNIKVLLLSYRMTSKRQGPRYKPKGWSFQGWKKRLWSWRSGKIRQSSFRLGCRSRKTNWFFYLKKIIDWINYSGWKIRNWKGPEFLFRSTRKILVPCRNGKNKIKDLQASWILTVPTQKIYKLLCKASRSRSNSWELKTKKLINIKNWSMTLKYKSIDWTSWFIRKLVRMISWKHQINFMKVS